MKKRRKQSNKIFIRLTKATLTQIKLQKKKFENRCAYTLQKSINKKFQTFFACLNKFTKKPIKKIN